MNDTPVTALDYETVKERLKRLSPEEYAALVKTAQEAVGAMPFIPNPGAQSEAYFSKADMLLYGGKPGGGKTALGIGLALNEHHRSLLLRRQFSDTEGMQDTTRKLLGGAAKGMIGGNRPKYRKPDGGVIHYGGVNDDGTIGWLQGVPHDLIYVDEAATFTEQTVRMTLGWLRPEKKGQRCRVVLGSNPPLDSTGYWLTDYFAPWLDPSYENPASPGELRWFLPDGKDGFYECAPDDVTELNGSIVRAKSRTFIPADYRENPYYDTEAYTATLAEMNAAERDILMNGNFLAVRGDQFRQIIPTDWVKAAMSRWSEDGAGSRRQVLVSADVTDGGADQTVIIPVYDGWFFGEPRCYDGADLASCEDLVGCIMEARRKSVPAVIDMGGGYGGAPRMMLEGLGVKVYQYKGIVSTDRVSSCGVYRFDRVRTESYWRLREALNPENKTGIALPPDNDLLHQLTQPTYTLKRSDRYMVVCMEKKAVTKKALGRSPDLADAAAMAALFYGRACRDAEAGFGYGREKTYVVGEAHRKRRRRRSAYGEKTRGRAEHKPRVLSRPQ